MRYIAMNGEEQEIRLTDGKSVQPGPGEYVSEEGEYMDDLGGGLRVRGEVDADDLDLFDFSQYGFTGHVEWDGSNHVLVEDEPAAEASARGEWRS